MDWTWVRLSEGISAQQTSLRHFCNAVQNTDISAVLAKDAFLVFRALCKLSTRSSESSTGSDPTAIRGKVRCQA